MTRLVALRSIQCIKSTQRRYLVALLGIAWLTVPTSALAAEHLVVRELAHIAVPAGGKIWFNMAARSVGERFVQ